MIKVLRSNRSKCYQILTIVLVFSVSAYRQISAQEISQREAYIFYDELIGQTNSGVFKGVLYTNEYRTINERHQFFKTANFETGSLTSNGQTFFELPLRYDVYLDNVLVVNDALSNRPIMVFDKEGVAKFEIAGHSFEYLSAETSDKIESGFFEVLLTNELLTLYMKHKKKIFKKTDAQNLYYEFKDGYFYLLYTGKTYHPFKNVKELTNIFPDYRKELRAIQKEHGNLKKSDAEAYVLAVLTDFLSLTPIRNQDAL